MSSFTDYGFYTQYPNKNTYIGKKLIATVLLRNSQVSKKSNVDLGCDFAISEEKPIVVASLVIL